MFGEFNEAAQAKTSFAKYSIEFNDLDAWEQETWLCAHVHYRDSRKLNCSDTALPCVKIFALKCQKLRTPLASLAPCVIKSKVKVEFSLEKVWKWQCFDCEFLEIWEWLKITRGLFSQTPCGQKTNSLKMIHYRHHFVNIFCSQVNYFLTHLTI